MSKLQEAPTKATKTPQFAGLVALVAWTAHLPSEIRESFRIPSSPPISRVSLHLQSALRTVAAIESNSEIEKRKWSQNLSEVQRFRPFWIKQDHVALSALILWENVAIGWQKEAKQSYFCADAHFVRRLIGRASVSCQTVDIISASKHFNSSLPPVWCICFICFNDLFISRNHFALRCTS